MQRFPFNRSGLRARQAFSLIELLVVIAVMALMAAMSGPVLSSLTGAKSVGRAASDLSDMLQVARAYAMANRTYVRVGFAQVSVANMGFPSNAMVVWAFYAADGSLSNASAGDMADASKWPALSRPLILDRFISINVDSIAPNTVNDVVPTSSDIGPLTGRRINGLSVNPRFDGFVQFSPEGEARVVVDSPARQIKIALDRSNGESGKNPFILRISGSNGIIQVLRKGSGI